MNSPGQTPDTLWHALTDKFQRQASWISIIISFFNAYSGIGIVQLFCAGIFDSIQKLGGHSMFTLKQQVYYIGGAAFVGSVLSYYSVMLFSRKALFVGGHFVMGLLFFLEVYFIQIK